MAEVTPAVSDTAFAEYLVEINLISRHELEATRLRKDAAARDGISISLIDEMLRQGLVTQPMLDLVKTSFGATPAAAPKQKIEKRGESQQIGHYALLRLLGTGAMGAVYLAEDVLAGRKVAVKILDKKLTSDSDYLLRFQREARLLMTLKHANIVAGYGFGEAQGIYFYAMEYYQGESLGTILEREKYLPWPRAVDLIAQTARGLRHAHERGIIHRDIKPQNIMLTPEGVVKILDLGLSKNILENDLMIHTRTGTAMGTLDYISPEQARAERNLDGRTDIYALGAMFFHLLTGRRPFEGKSPIQIMSKHLTEPVPDPAVSHPGIPEAITAVIRKAMSKAVADRYKDCGELLAALDQIESSSPGN